MQYSLLILLAWGFFIWFPGDRGATFPLILFTAIMLVVTVVTSFRGANFLVFGDRIELRRPFSRNLRGIIWLSQIAQVRYGLSHDLLSCRIGFLTPQCSRDTAAVAFDQTQRDCLAKAWVAN